MRRILAKFAPFLLAVLLGAPCLAPAAESPARDDAFYEKYNSYIALINVNLEDVQEAIEHYYLSVGEFIGDAGAGRSDLDYRNYVFSGATEPAMKAAESFVAKEPKLEVDAIVGKLHPVMTKVWGLLREADAYYGEKAYLKDGFAKGKTLHDGIGAALAEYWPLFDEFSLDMDLMEKEGNARELAKMLEEGRVVTAAMLKMLNACEEAHAWLEDKDIGDDNIHELDADGFRSSVLAVVAKAREELKTAATPAAVLKEGLPAGLVENYLKTAAAVETCAANMIELAKKGRPGEDSPAVVEKPGDEMPSDFIYQINKLIDLYNQIWE